MTKFNVIKDGDTLMLECIYGKGKIKIELNKILAYDLADALESAASSYLDYDEYEAHDKTKLGT